MDQFKCGRCKKLLPQASFHKITDLPGHRPVQTTCKSCKRRLAQKYRRKWGILHKAGQGYATLLQCKNCGRHLPIGHFHKSRGTKRGWHTQCKECLGPKVSARAATFRKWYLKENHGIEPQDYEQMLANQHGVCAICGVLPERSRHGVLVVDHDHATGKIRGLLCDSCNLGLGKLGDTLHNIQAAVKYLEATCCLPSAT